MKLLSLIVRRVAISVGKRSRWNSKEKRIAQQMSEDRVAGCSVLHSYLLFLWLNKQEARVMIGQLDCSSLLTRVGFAHIYLEAWLRWSVMLQEICSSWLLCWLWLPRYRAILRKKRRKTNFLSTQQITLPEEGESRGEWNPARTGCQEHQARLLQIWKKSRINEN